MEDQVDEVKQKTDIVSLIGSYIQVKKAGRNYKALCPFHSEKTPSFMISPELQMYKCFGCGETGDVYSFLEKFEGMDFSEALRFLAEKAGVTLKSIRPGEQSEKERLYELNTQTNRFYQYVLASHPAGKVALNYLLKERGLKPETIKNFQLGFSPVNLGVLTKFLVEKKKFNIKEVEKTGTIYFKGRDTVDRFRGRVIFPLFDHRGNVAGFAGRILPGVNDKEMAKYINTPETPVYHKSNLLFGLNLVKGDIKEKGFAIVVEGELDMISSWQAGIKNVVAIKGTALTEEQVRLLSRFTKKLVLALDSDIAGDTAARRGIVIAQKEGMEIKVAIFKDFKDPDEAARKNVEAYKKAIDEAIDVWDFIINSVFAKFDATSGEGQAKISRELVPILSSIPDKIVQAHYIGLVARRLNVPNEAVYNQIESIKTEDRPKEELKANLIELTPQAQKGRQQLLEERLLTLAFQGDSSILLKPEVAKLVVTPLTKRLLEEFLLFLDKNKVFSSAEFSNNLPKELLNGYADMALKDLQGLADDEEAIAREQNLVIQELDILYLRHKLEILGAQIREFEESKETDKLLDAQEKFSAMSERLSKYEDEAKGGIILQEGN
jgi:DNA primase